VALSVLLVAVVVDLFLLCGGEEAAGNFLEKLVGDLLGAVSDSLESEDWHGSMGRTPGIRVVWLGRVT
jgi:hypothetical protein